MRELYLAAALDCAEGTFNLYECCHSLCGAIRHCRATSIKDTLTCEHKQENI